MYTDRCASYLWIWFGDRIFETYIIEGGNDTYVRIDGEVCLCPLCLYLTNIQGSIEICIVSVVFIGDPFETFLVRIVCCEVLYVFELRSKIEIRRRVLEVLLDLFRCLLLDAHNTP